MLKKITIWGVVAVAAALAMQTLLRTGPPKSLFVPPRMELPGLDEAPERESSQPAERTVPERGAETAAGQDADAVAASEPRKFQRRFMFDCGDVRIFVRVGEGEAALLPESSLTGQWIPLALAGRAWRGRYANEDILFEPNGDVAAFLIGNNRLPNCVGTADRGALAEVNTGVFFQAFGDRPPWTFEITAGELTLTTDGARVVEVPLREPTDSGGRMTFRSAIGAQEMLVTLDRVRCYDAASGETFELTAAVTFNRAWYYGCGRRISYR
jgi:uncharacterized membrane protein